MRNNLKLMKNINIKVAKVIIPVTFFLAALFYLTDINFQLEYFKMMGFLKTVLFVILPVLPTAIIFNYMSKRALKNRKLDDGME
jgi:cytochrome c oxidase subunit IV